MSELFSKSLSEVLEMSSSSAPTPGGGSVSAICAAFAASMGAMVASLTIGKKKYRDVEQQMVSLKSTTMGLLSEFQELVGEDIKQFGNFMDAYRLPKETPEEKENRDSSVQGALKGATETPLKVARRCVSLLEAVCELAPLGNKMAISDAGVAAYLGEASLNAVLLSVDINIPMIKDSAFVKEVVEEKEGLAKQARELKEKALAIVFERMN